MVGQNTNWVFNIGYRRLSLEHVIGFQIRAALRLRSDFLSWRSRYCNSNIVPPLFQVFSWEVELGVVVIDDLEKRE